MKEEEKKISFNHLFFEQIIKQILSSDLKKQLALNHRRDALAYIEHGSSIISTQLRELFSAENNFKVLSFGKFNDIIFFKFKIDDIEYDISTLHKCLSENIEFSKQKTDRAVLFLKKIIILTAPEYTNIMDFLQEYKIKDKANPLLLKFRDVIDSQNFKGAFDMMLAYPLIDRTLHVSQRKHLMLGFESDTGKTLLGTILMNIYKGGAITQQVRPYQVKNDFDYRNWNLTVHDKILIFIDDDSKDRPPDEDYLKNSLGVMPLACGTHGKRFEALYKGSSMICLNNMHAFFKEYQINKRIFLIRMDIKLFTVFTREELEELSKVIRDMNEIKTYIHIHNYLSEEIVETIVNHKNKWIESKKEKLENEIIGSIIANKANRFPARILYTIYGRQYIDDFLKSKQLDKADNVLKNVENLNNDTKQKKTHEPFIKSNAYFDDTYLNIFVKNKNNYTDITYVKINNELETALKVPVKIDVNMLVRLFKTQVNSDSPNNIIFAQLKRGAFAKKITRENIEKESALVFKLRNSKFFDAEAIMHILNKKYAPIFVLETKEAEEFTVVILNKEYHDVQEKQSDIENIESLLREEIIIEEDECIISVPESSYNFLYEEKSDIELSDAEISSETSNKIKVAKLMFEENKSDFELLTKKGMLNYIKNDPDNENNFILGLLYTIQHKENEAFINQLKRSSKFDSKIKDYYIKKIIYDDG